MGLGESLRRQVYATDSWKRSERMEDWSAKNDKIL